MQQACKFPFAEVPGTFRHLVSKPCVLDGEDMTKLPLYQRKGALNRVVHETERLAISHVIEEHSRALYALTEENNLTSLPVDISTKRTEQRVLCWVSTRTEVWFTRDT